MSHLISTYEVRLEIQMIIAQRLQETPERSLLLISFDELEDFSRLGPREQIAVAQQLDGYRGVPLNTPDLLIEWGYDIHPMLPSRRMEVVILKEGFEDIPEVFLAEDAAALLSEVSEERDVQVDETFSAKLPATFIELREEMTAAQKGRFRTLIKEKLVQYGLALKGGNVTSSLKIRRTQ